MEIAHNDYRQMHEHLSNDKKLLAGKLNSLEEFRIMRDDLMKKFAMQEKFIEEREKEFQRTIYNLERQHILAKDRLKTEMEQRLYKLSCDFKNSAELCIADTTKRVIRENIYINNEMTNMIETHRRLEDENKEFRERDQRISAQLWEESAEKRRLFHCKRVSEEVIQKLENQHEKLMQALRDAEVNKDETRQIREKLARAEHLKYNAELKVRQLEQNLHAAACERNLLQQNAMTWITERVKLRDCVKHSTNAAKAAITAYKQKSKDLPERLLTIICILESALSETGLLKKSASLATIPSLGVIYRNEVGGLMPLSEACKEEAVQRIKEQYTKKPSEPKVETLKDTKVETHVTAQDIGSAGSRSIVSTASSLKYSGGEGEEERSSETFYSVDFAGELDVSSVSRSEYLDDEKLATYYTVSTISEETVTAEDEESLENVEDDDEESNP